MVWDAASVLTHVALSTLQFAPVCIVRLNVAAAAPLLSGGTGVYSHLPQEKLTQQAQGWDASDHEQCPGVRQDPSETEQMNE